MAVLASLILPLKWRRRWCGEGGDGGGGGGSSSVWCTTDIPKFALYAIESAALTRKRNSSTAFKNSSGSSASDASFFRLCMHNVRCGAVR